VVDLGTRFGTSVNSNGLTEVSVFQGRVEVTAAAKAAKLAGKLQLSQGMAMIADGQNAISAAPIPETAFPQSGQIILARPQNCGFDVLTHAAFGEIPAEFGYWRGPAYALIGKLPEIRPFSGKGMLQFLAPASGPAGDSEVWQLVDMRPFKKFLAEGSAEAKLSAYFNRLPCDARAGDTFGLTLAAFHGAAADAKSLWAGRASTALALADKLLTTDNNPTTWEEIEVSARLPAETDFVIVSLRAIAPKSADGKTPLFPGHFADLVDLKLHTPMRSSSIAAAR
jgi:hypothetical protein